MKVMQDINRLILAAASVIVAMTMIVTVTYMGFAANDEIENALEMGRQSVIVVEEYMPPGPMHPGDSVDKVVGFFNNGETVALIRVRYDESWTAKDGSVLSNTVKVFQDSLEVARKNWTPEGFQNTSLWADGGDGYWYYRRVLHPETGTDPVLASVMFNDALRQSPELLSYASADYQLVFSVDSVVASADETALKSHFGSHVRASITGDDVTWTFN